MTIFQISELLMIAAGFATQIIISSAKLADIRKGLDTMFGTQKALQDEITQIEATAQANKEGVAAAIAGITNKLDAVTASVPDLQPEIDRLTAVAGVINETSAAAAAALAAIAPAQEAPASNDASVDASQTGAAA